MSLFLPDKNELHVGPFTVTAEQPRLVGRRDGYLWFPTITILPQQFLLVTAYAGEDALTAEPTGFYFTSHDSGATWADPTFDIFSETALTLGDMPSLLLPFALCGTVDNDRLEGTLLSAEGGRESVAAGGLAALTGFPRPIRIVKRGEVSGWAFNGQTLRARDGSLRATVYGTFAGDSRHSLCLVESDNGRDWRFCAVIADANLCPLPGADGPCESSLIRLSDGRLLCVFRLEGRFANVFERGSQFTFQPYARSFSADEGHTWSSAAWLPETCASVQPCLTRLDCGGLALSGGRPGIYLWLCENEEASVWHSLDLAEYHNHCHPAEPITHIEETTGYTEIVSLGGDSYALVYDRTPFGWRRHPGDSAETNSIWYLPLRIERR